MSPRKRALSSRLTKRTTMRRHPREELQRLYSSALTIQTDRLLCGLCGELLYVLDEAGADHPGSDRNGDWLQDRRIVIPD